VRGVPKGEKKKRPLERLCLERRAGEERKHRRDGRHSLYMKGRKATGSDFRMTCLLVEKELTRFPSLGKSTRKKTIERV